jgi:N-acetylmuramoyl-L-alanine amidase
LDGTDPASLNDTGEFAEVDVGPGFVPGEAEIDLGTTEAPGGFSMNRFRTFVAGLGLRHFSAEELLFMGHSNAPGGTCAGRNSLPPEELWNNIANTARMLDEIRHRLGARCRINSAYRSESYNRCVGGESRSLHTLFNAIDFRCEAGTAAQWHRVAKAVRASDPKFKGGIGKYNTFVHIDTRGREANW